MYSLPKPGYTVSDVLSRCTGAIADVGLVARLNAIKHAIAQSEQSYDRLATGSGLHSIAQISGLGPVSNAELIELYENHLSARRGAARLIYDAIRNAAFSNLCPLCGIGTVAQIDHHLPKSRFPDLSVVPINLVPACHFCNNTKRNRFPQCAGEQTFHPYYDAHLLTEQWIRATLDRGTPLNVSFRVDPPSHWTKVDRQRAARHFAVCGLGISFGTNANAGLVSLKRRLEQLYAAGGGAEVQAYLEEERDCHDDKLNSWQHTMYAALAADSWFVSGGFCNIVDALY